MSMDGISDRLPDCVEQYLAYIQTVQGKSPLTAQEYAYDLRTFLRFLSKKKLRTGGVPFEEIDVSGLGLDFLKGVTTQDIISFLLYASRERDNNTASRARKLSAVKAFYKYLTVKTHQLENNPAKDIDAPALRRSLPKFLSLEESLELLEAVDGKNKERDYCILTLFLNCGLRLAELVGIDISDFDRERTTVRVLGKRNKERFVYLNDACRDALASYLSVRDKIPDIKDKDALLISRLKRRISRETVQKLVEKYLQAAGLEDKHYSTHKLRHTAATLMYRHGGVDVRVLKDILGHEQLNTTQIYTHVSDTQIEKAMKSNPLSGVKRKKTPLDEN